MLVTQQEDKFGSLKGMWHPKRNPSALEAETGDSLNKLIS